MNHDLETALMLHRWWRDRGNDILLIGVLVEFLIDAFWPERPHLLPLLRGRRATAPLLKWYAHLLTARGATVVVIGLAVFAGIALERWQGTSADDIADQIRAKQQERIVDAEDRATSAQQDASQSKERAANALKAAADAQLEQEKLKKGNLELAKALQPRVMGTLAVSGIVLGGLERLAGTRVLIQSVPDWEAGRFAVSIANTLEAFGWKPEAADTSTTTVSQLHISDGLQIWTMRAGIAISIPPGMKQALTMPPVTEAERRAWIAGEALSEYLNAFKISNVHHGLKLGNATEASPPFNPKFSPPEDVIILLVGSNPAWEELKATPIFPTQEEFKETETKLLELQRKGPWPTGWR